MMDPIFVENSESEFSTTTIATSKYPKLRLDSGFFSPSPSTSNDDSEDDEDLMSEFSEISDFDDFMDSENDDDNSTQTLSEIQEEIDEDFERLLKEMDDIEAQIQGIREILI